MRMPQKPPDFAELSKEIANSPELLQQIVISRRDPTSQDKYLHWDKLRRLRPPEGMTIRAWWFSLKLGRANFLKHVPLEDSDGQPFNYAIPDVALEELHHIDKGAGGSIEFPNQITNPDTRDRYIISSLMEEAIRSSQLEGAVTTRAIAKEIIRTDRKPRDRSEQMVLNNFLTMQRIRGMRDQDLSPDLVLELQRLVTQETLDDPSATGRLRYANEKVHVVDTYGEVFHTPPPADRLEDRLEAMCDFANGKTPENFMHPVVRAIILHFWLAYDHPFVDGNGRCARALFYWSLLRSGYWLFEFISISNMIYRAPVQYGRAFLYTETDDNDLTYFILYHLDIIRKALRELHEYVQRKTEQLKAAERFLHNASGLNHRQRDLIAHALRHPHAEYSFQSHQISHGVVYETARTDLMDLADKGVLVGHKVGRRWYFKPADQLEKRLSELE